MQSDVGQRSAVQQYARSGKREQARCLHRSPLTRLREENGITETTVVGKGSFVIV